MPTEIKRKIGNPPMFIDEGVHCEIGRYGNDADGCFGGAVISYPNGACCSTKDDHFITYPNGACCKEANKEVKLLFVDGNCCTELETPIIDFNSATQKLSIVNQQKGVKYMWSYSALDKKKNPCFYLGKMKDDNSTFIQMFPYPSANCVNTAEVYVSAELGGLQKIGSKIITVNN